MWLEPAKSAKKTHFGRGVWSKHRLRLQSAKNHPFAMRTHNVAAQLSPARPCIHVQPSWPVTSTNVFHPDGRGLAVGIFDRKKNASPRARVRCVVSFLNGRTTTLYSSIKRSPNFRRFADSLYTAMQFTADRRHALPIHDHPKEIWLWRTQRRRFNMNTCSRGRELDCDACALSADDFFAVAAGNAPV